MLLFPKVGFDDLTLALLVPEVALLYSEPYRPLLLDTAFWDALFVGCR